MLHTLVAVCTVNIRPQCFDFRLHNSPESGVNNHRDKEQYRNTVQQLAVCCPYCMIQMTMPYKLSANISSVLVLGYHVTQRCHATLTYVDQSQWLCVDLMPDTNNQQKRLLSRPAILLSLLYLMKLHNAQSKRTKMS